MKVAPPKYGYNDKKEPVLPLIGNPTAHMKTNSASFELRSNPADVDSPKCRMTTLRIQGGEDVCTMLQLPRDITKILKGLALTAAQAEHEAVVSILSGTHQSAFKTKIVGLKKQAFDAAVANVGTNSNVAALQAAGPDPHLTKDMVREALKHMVWEAMPKKVLARVKRYLH